MAKTFAGLETELLKELHALGAKNCEKLSRAVAFEGDMEMLYRANYYCRTALRILWRQKRFTFKNNRQFYDQIFDFPAEEYLSSDGTLAVHATIVDTIFSTPLYASVLAKDAICDRFRDRFERRPSVDKEYPDVQFHLHIYKDEAQLFMDSSGESLHKRGYKVRNHPAPLNEVVAAAMIMKSGWKGDCDFIDPMCGGATLLVEAAMQALNIPAGFYRREYGFYQWKNFDRALWKKVRDEADIKDDVDINFYGSDIDGRFLDIARANVQKARLQDFIILERQDIRHSSPENVPSVVMMNPPYGERLSVDDINTLYQEIGDTLKKRYAGCRAFIISSDLNALKHIGLKPAHKWPMLNGSLECMFQEYELFAGDRKQFVTNKMQKK
ncbi:MAG: class I SAM-dependent RNA methyltransferase [Bacteroidales bacterium]|nr:class I SAM-dependent RNA methyltransferase [Bacteroidales bacterium]